MKIDSLKYFISAYFALTFLLYIHTSSLLIFVEFTESFEQYFRISLYLLFTVEGSARG